MKILPEIILKRTDGNNKPFKWAAESVGFRNKIGGESEFIHEDDFPICKSCNKRMSFYGQLDSIDDEHIIADCGLISIFICFDCYETESIITSG